MLTPGVDGSILPAKPAAEEILRELLFWAAENRCAAARSATRALAERFSQTRTAEETRAVLAEVASGKGLEVTAGKGSA